MHLKCENSLSLIICGGRGGLKVELKLNFLVAFLVAQIFFTAFSQKRLGTHGLKYVRVHLFNTKICM